MKSLFRVTNNDETELETFDEIVDGASFRGINSWLMIFAMLVACIGLNVNSKAAVIGAMIASPLMGPVFGIGFALATDHYKLLKYCLKNLGIVVVICLLSSTIYYFLTPFHGSTDELYSFTHPTIFDIILALLGGALGMLGISRKDGNRVLVGVAVATACIPPLCSAGYGLANQDWEFFWGGLYMYALNSLFIGIATFFMAKYLKYKRIGSDFSKTNIAIWVVALSVILLGYGGFLTFQLVQKQSFEVQSQMFIEAEIEKNYFVLKHKLTKNETSPNVIEVAIVGDSIDDDVEKKLTKKLKKYKLEGSKLVIYRAKF